MGELCDLFGDSFNYARVGVSDSDNSDTSSEINQLIAINVFENRTMGLVNEGSEHGANTTGYNLASSFLHG